MSLGDVVWLVIGVCFVGLSVGSFVVPSRLARPNDVVVGFLSSWLGRLFVIGLWAEFGFHVFCQRP